MEITRVWTANCWQSNQLQCLHLIFDSLNMIKSCWHWTSLFDLKHSKRGNWEAGALWVAASNFSYLKIGTRLAVAGVKLCPLQWMLCCIKSIQQGRRSQKIVARGWGSVKCCTLFSIPIETQTLTMQTASRLRQMGRLHWTAFLFSWLVVTFWASILACRVWVRACETFGKDELQRIFYTSLGSCPLFTGTRVQPLHLPVWKLWCMVLSFAVFEKHSAMVVSNQPGTDILSATPRPNGTLSGTTGCNPLFWPNVKSFLPGRASIVI